MLLGGVILLQLFIASQCTVYFEERFLDDSLSGWAPPEEAPEEGLGKLKVEKPQKVNDEKEDLALHTTQDARFYRSSAMLEKPFDTKDKTLCVQFTVKHEQKIDCGGGYLKLMSKGFQQKDLSGESPYEIMFGPDICGYAKRLVHVIFSYKGENYLIKREINCPDDTRTHLYTLIVKPDNTYEVLIDQESAQSGSIADDWEMLPPKKIKDPEVSKPDDWVDEAEIDDPEDKKPDDWDQPETVPDPDATKPVDWDEGLDGEWVPPSVPNKEFKGEWTPKKMPNPAYKGPWVHPMIDNPEFKDDPNLYARDIHAVAIEEWQVKSGTFFDNMIITDDVDECNEHAKYWKARSEYEKVHDKDIAEPPSTEDLKPASDESDEKDELEDLEPEKTEDKPEPREEL